MQYKIEVRPLAVVEILEAYDWYEQQREGLGAEFLNELDVFYSSLLLNPNTYSYYDKPVRQGKISRFPYMVVYEVVEAVIVVYSVFMVRQNLDKKGQCNNRNLRTRYYLSPGTFKSILTLMPSLGRDRRKFD